MDAQERAKRFSEALVSEIKAEMGRQDLSSRGLGRLIDKSSQYMSDRLDGGSSKTGERVTLNARDLSLIAQSLSLSEVALVQRAQAVLHARSNVIVGSFGHDEEPQEEERAVAFTDTDDEDGYDLE